MIDESKPPPAARVIRLPSSRFFVRQLPLAPGENVVRQIELALESRSSFPVGQLYYGYLLAPGLDTALVFAAYRKHFTAAETAGWNEAIAVLPAFLAVLGRIPASPTIRLWTDGPEIVAMAWSGRAPLPVAVLARETKDPSDPGQRASLLAEIRDRVELPGAAVEEYAGPITDCQLSPKGELEFKTGGDAARLAATLAPAALETADVRDKEVLATQKALRKRDTILWRTFQACAAGLVGLLLWEIGLLAAGARVTGLNARVQQQSANVQKIETAQSLSRRIAEITRRRLLPFEMLALINVGRPPSIQFMRTVTTGLFAMEIQAQTANAADVGVYESALRSLPGLASVETRDLRSREGVTTFVLALTYKPDSLRQEGTP